MKKVYRKPEVTYETFRLSESISSGCYGIANLGEGICSVYLPDAGVNVFNQAGLCEYSGPGFDDAVCYHAPTDWNNVFSS